MFYTFLSKLLKAMGFKVSYEAVRNWYHKKIYLILIRRYVAIDETVINGKKKYYVWVERMEIISAKIKR